MTYVGMPMPCERCNRQQFLLEHAYLRFHKDHAPLIDISELHFNWQGLATLQGPSGSGKTSFFRLISGWFTGPHPQRICQFDPSIDLHKSVRMIGGHASLLPWKSVWANAQFQLGQADINIFSKAIVSVGLDENVLYKYPYELSLGMYKRIELVIAILQEPTILLLDEFFSSIDRSAKENVRDFLEARRGQSLTLASAHEEDLREWIGGQKFSFIQNHEGVTVTGVSVS